MNPPMSDYLWDKSGPTDPAVAKLESLLARQRLAPGRGPELVIGPRAELRLVESASPRTMPVNRSRWTPLAAMVGLAVIAGWLARPALGPWLRVEARGGAVIGSREAGTRLHVGQWLKTDSAASAEIAVADLGVVTVKPNSKIRIKDTGGRHILDLPYGSIHAFITAPPRVFIVDTPGARAVDMGCEYTLDVEKDGSGILRVTLGHVLLEGPGGLQSDVPMLGGTCRIRRDVGPGTPYFDDASSLFIRSLEVFDFAGQASGELDVVLGEARARDALSLWHLLSRTQGEQRERVLARLHQLKPLPRTISRQAVLELNPVALRDWFEQMRPF